MPGGIPAIDGPWCHLSQQGCWNLGQPGTGKRRMGRQAREFSWEGGMTDGESWDEKVGDERVHEAWPVWLEPGAAMPAVHRVPSGVPPAKRQQFYTSTMQRLSSWTMPVICPCTGLSWAMRCCMIGLCCIFCSCMSAPAKM